MGYYCSTNDVGSRLGLNSAQRTQASTKLTLAMKRATIEIDQEFRDYGRGAPSGEIGSSTLSNPILAGATSIPLVSNSAFATTGEGSIDADSFSWTGKGSNSLTGCTGISVAHASGDTVRGGEMTHILTEICADLAAAYYMEDEGGSFEGGVGGTIMRERGTLNLKRLAHLGLVN